MPKINVKSPPHSQTPNIFFWLCSAHYTRTKIHSENIGTSN